MAASSTMSWAVLVAVVLMMQCCNVVVAARPLLMMEALQGPGSNNHNCQAPNGSCP
jgi:hypothetical protein